jgi:threonine synthase
MRKAFAVVLLTLVGAAPAAAQDRAAIELTRQEIQTERQAIVAKNLPLTEQQSATFWPLYREYRTALAPVGDRYVALLTGYAEKYGSLTDPDAEAMLKEFFAIQNEKQKTQSKYVDRFKKVLPATQVARFYQIENKLDAIVNYDLAGEVPLAQ